MTEQEVLEFEVLGKTPCKELLDSDYLRYQFLLHVFMKDIEENYKQSATYYDSDVDDLDYEDLDWV